MSSAACATLPESSTPMAVAGVAVAPHGFVEFCERKPADCGVDAAELAGMKAASSAPSTTVAAIQFDWTGVFASQLRSAESVAAPAAATLQPASLTYDWSTAFPVRDAIQKAVSLTPMPAAPAPRATHASTLRIPMSSRTWTLLIRTNDTINRAIAQRSDADIYGVSELWTTPLAEGRAMGDCEDYVLEKRRALAAAGLPREALSIAVVTTDRGLTHAVLVVATDKGDYVLDSLSAWILPWAKTGYRWKERQVNGSASHWAFATTAPVTPDLGPNLLLASLR